MKFTTVTQPNRFNGEVDKQFYKIEQTDEKSGKRYQIHVTNRGFDVNKEYEYQLVTKSSIGTLSIHTGTATPRQIIRSYQKGALQTVYLKNEYGNFVSVLTMKGGRIFSITKCIIEDLKVGDMHSFFPKNVDFGLWKELEAKTWADVAFGPLDNLVVDPNNITITILE